jgi:acyl-CoA synthetase (AMP-forming)/AMP-acid ligase II
VPLALATWAEVSPGAPALLAPGWGALDYHGLVRTVDALASRLRALGIGRQDIVLVSLSDGPALVTTLLTGMTAAVVAPLSWDMTWHELGLVIAAGGARAIVVPEDGGAPAREAAAEAGLAVFELAEFPAGSREPFRLAGDPVAPPSPAILPASEDLALIVHSSGTTGRPKRVPRTHGNIVATMRAGMEVVRLSERDRCLNMSPMAFSQGLNALLSTIWSGGSFVALPGPHLDAFPAWVREYAPTWFSATPTVLRALIADEAAMAALREHPPRVLRASAGALADGEIDRLEAALGTRILHSYGMSEASFVAAERLGDYRRKPGSVGLPNCEVAIVDASGQRVPPGDSGEIVVRGANVFPGYLDDPEANAAAFLPGGWFRTGDVGRFDDDGYLSVTGRLKEMINRGGMSISPREIEEALLSAPAVAEACVFGIPHPFLGEDVAAAVVLRPGETISRRALRAEVARRLSAQKVPHVIVFVERIPKGPTGKPRRHELANQLQGWLARAADGGDPSAAHPFAAHEIPRSGSE